MIIRSKNNMPKIFSISRDYQAILRLYDILVNVEKSDVDNLVSLVNADKCPSKYLPLLASSVGYTYDYNLSYDANRLIIKYYPLMIRLRGSMEGIILACAVALNSSDVLKSKSVTGALNYINPIYDAANKTLRIFVQNYKFATKLYDLLEVVRPVGLNLQVIESESKRPHDEIEFADKVHSAKFDITISHRYTVMGNEITYIQVTTKPENWDSNYEDYYMYDGSDYVPITSDVFDGTNTYYRDVNEVGTGEVHE